MGCFKMPLGLCHEIETIIKKFWWEQRGEKRKIHWLKWEELTKSKLEGGMGFRDIAMFNDSLLAKQAWKLLKNPDSLLHKVFKACFFPNCTFMEAKCLSSGSHAWRSILHGREVLLRGCQWRIGNGKAVSIWQDHWLLRKNMPQVQSHRVDTMADAKVEILINGDTRQWDHGLFSPQEAELIKSIPLSRCAAEDTLFWPFTSNRAYTNKSGYRFLKAETHAEWDEDQMVHDKVLWRTISSL